MKVFSLFCAQYVIFTSLRCERMYVNHKSVFFFFVKSLICTYVGKQAEHMQDYVKYIDPECALIFKERERKKRVRGDHNFKTNQ